MKKKNCIPSKGRGLESCNPKPLNLRRSRKKVQKKVRFARPQDFHELHRYSDCQEEFVSEAKLLVMRCNIFPRFELQEATKVLFRVEYI